MTEDIIISSGVVSSGIELDAFMTVLSGGTAVNTVVSNGGILHVYNGGTAKKTTVLSGGELTIYIGGTATETVENGGWVEPLEGEVTFAPHTIHGLQLMDDGTEREGYASASIHSGTIVDGATVSEALLHISSGGTAKNTMIFSGGELDVCSDGTMHETVISSGGSVIVRSGGIAKSIAVFCGGELIVYSGGTASEIIENGGYVRINDGAVASFAAFALHDLQLKTCTNTTVHSGTSATGFTVCDIGRLDVLSGGTAENTTVLSGGVLRVASGGLAENTSVLSGGIFHIECGGTATRIRAEKGAGIFARSVSPDTHVQGVFAGKAFEVKGGISGCVLIKRGPFDDCDDTDSPFAEGDTLTVFSGGKAVGLIVSNGGELIVSSGGTAESPIICDGGLLVVHSGGTALDVRKEEGAKTEINNGAVVTAAASPRSS